MKRYLGDAVYAEQDSNGLSRVVLTTEDGEKVTNRIVLEPEVLVSLIEFIGAAIVYDDGEDLCRRATTRN
jgi:hypothetical protein